jgi:hypothetical protein
LREFPQPRRVESLNSGIGHGANKNTEPFDLILPLRARRERPRRRVSRGIRAVEGEC